MRSSQRSRPRAWLQRWTRGLQPPETGGHAVGIAVRRGGAREHDPGPVVVGEDRRPLERAGREHDPLRADLPEPPAALDGEHVVAVVDRDHGRPLEHADPVERLARDLLGEDHAPARRRRGRAARSAPPPTTSISQWACIASYRGVVAPATSRPLPASGSATSPSSSSTSVARSSGSRADLHERVRLLLAGRVDAARPAAVERAEAAEHAVPHERRGERLARRGPRTQSPRT